VAAQVEGQGHEGLGHGEGVGFGGKVEFLGFDGSVVATETQSVGPVAPKAKGQFSVHSAKQQVAGYRYKPLS